MKQGFWTKALGAEFKLSLLVFLLYITVYLAVSLLDYLPAIVYLAIFLAYTFIYIIDRGRMSGRIAMVLHLLFAAMLVLFVLLFAQQQVVLAQEIENLFVIMHTFSFYLVLALPVYFLAALGLYLYRVSGRKTLGIALLCVGLAVSLAYFIFVVNYFTYGDEVYLAFSAINQTFHGMDPYTTSVASQLYALTNIVGGTINTNNTLVGRMDYPAFYFISFIPFYLLSQPNIYSLGHIDLTAQAAVYIFITLLYLVYTSRRKETMKFKLALLVFLLFAMSTSAAINPFLMLLLVMVSYFALESRWAFLPLGLAASLQQEVWLPVALLIAYSFNNYGFRKGARDLAGALMVFLLINGYFIALNPSAFISGVLLPIGKILPFQASPFSTWLLFSYGVPLTASGMLILITAAGSLLTLLYFNRKELIPFLSMIPLLFVFHGLSGYFTFYIFFLFFALDVDQKSGPGTVTRALRSNRLAAPLLGALVCVAMAAAVYAAHGDYESNFNIQVTNQSIHFEGNTTVYNGDIVYGRLQNSTVYLFLQGYSRNGSTYLLFGYGNESLIPGARAGCQEYSCYINVNRITLPYNQTSYRITAVINGTGNFTVGTAFNQTQAEKSARVNYLHAIIYNNQYIYKSPAVYNYSK